MHLQRPKSTLVMIDIIRQVLHAESVPTVDLAKDSEMCLVVSDMENSTLLSVENPTAFAASQDIHDAIMMELIQQCYGLELLREGDSFRVAFKCSEQAIAFCLKVCFPRSRAPQMHKVLSVLHKSVLSCAMTTSLVRGHDRS